MKYRQVEKEIDELLCGPPTHGTRWRYLGMPALRDAGALKQTIAEDYGLAGWHCSFVENGVLEFWEEQVKDDSYEPHAGE